MVQAHCTNRPARSGHQVVGFDIQIPDVDYRKMLGVPSTCGYRHSEPAEGGTSKYKGVCRLIARSRGVAYIYWQAMINPQKKGFRLGIFPYTPEGEKDAARAYDKAAIKLWGDNALTNQQYYGDLEGGVEL